MYREALFALNPHTKEPRDLLKMLERQAKDTDYMEQEKLDKSALEKLKTDIGANLGKGFGAKTTKED